MNCKSLNYSRIARQYNCNRKTVRRFFENKGKIPIPRKKRAYNSILDSFKDIVVEKVDEGSTAISIYHFLKKKGYIGSYATIRDFCRKHRRSKQQQAVIRFETNPGLQAQVDWKENFKLKNKYNDEFEINIFLVVLGYSRYKYLMLTTDKAQTTVFKGLIESFKYFGGVPSEILFDNMRTIVDVSRTQYGKPVYNERFYEFSKDMGFKAKSCMAYRPQTKGKVESVARLMNRLTVYNGEFETMDDLNVIVQGFNKELNLEISQATGKSPGDLLKDEQKYLNPIPNKNVYEDYLNQNANQRKVSPEALVNIAGKRYSVPPQYINKKVFYQIENNTISIFDDMNILICTHQISDRLYNFAPDHYRKIAKRVISDAVLLDNICNKNLEIYDKIQ